MDVIARILDALKSLFHRKQKKYSVVIELPMVDFREQLEEQLDRIMKEERQKDEQHKPGPDIQTVYMRTRYRRLKSEAARQLKKAEKVQRIAMNHRRVRIRKKNLNRLVREIMKFVHLHRKAEEYEKLPDSVPIAENAE